MLNGIVLNPERYHIGPLDLSGYRIFKLVYKITVSRHLPKNLPLHMPQIIVAKQL
jgi:hypothetical protein